MAATYQQRVVYEAVGKLGTHPPAEDVYEQVAKHHPTISKSTVYRNLNQLTAEGKLLNIGKIDGVTRYDHNCQAHYHFECKACKRIFDIEGRVSDIYEHVKCPEGFDMQEHVLNFRGVCRECCGIES